jgi:predicted esterase
MNRFRLSLFVILSQCFAFSVHGQFDPLDGAEGEIGYPFRLYSPETASAENPLPLVVFLHGSGERRTDNVEQVKSHIQPLIDSCLGSEYPAYLVAPQFPKPYLSWDPIVVRQLTEILIATLPVDPNRVYITGISVGGRGTWEAAAKGLDLFAAAVTLSARSKYVVAEDLGKSGIPIWAFHGDTDPVVPVNETRWMIEDIIAAGGLPRYTELPGFQHNDWTPIYADTTGYTDYYENGDPADTTMPLYPWLFSQKLPEEPIVFPNMLDNEIIQLDFGTNHVQSNSEYWNNLAIDPVMETAVLSALLNTEGKPRKITFRIADGFEGTGNSGATAGTSYPSQVSSDFWWTGSSEGHEAALLKPGKLVIGNLPADKTFRLRFFASRTETDGELDQLTRFSANSQVVDLEATNNVNNIATLYGVSPNSSGEVEITVSPGPDGTGRYAYLNSMELLMEPYPITFAYWAELNGFDSNNADTDQNKNAIPDTLDFLYGNENDSINRNTDLAIQDGNLQVQIPIREEAAAVKLILERSTDLMNPWEVLASYDFSNSELNNLVIETHEDGLWLKSGNIPLEVGYFYRVRGLIP